MTIPEAKQQLINWCNSQVGYHESWDGSNKYGSDGDWDLKLYGFDASNVAWCDVFTDYAYIHNFGYELATRMTFQVPSGFALCRASADAYKQHGHWYDKNNPEVGDQIFFYYGGEINHTGIVVAVNGDQITCVEGNYSDSVGRTYYNYKISNQIAGYGRPEWKLVEEQTVEEVNSSDILSADKPTLSESSDTKEREYIKLRHGDGVQRPLPQVKAWQNLMLCWGYNLGFSGADGEFGDMTLNATIQFQQKVGLVPNGVVDKDDWEQAIYLE